MAEKPHVRLEREGGGTFLSCSQCLYSLNDRIMTIFIHLLDGDTAMQCPYCRKELSIAHFGLKVEVVT